MKRGTIFALGIPIDESGPQRPRVDSRRFNPVHTMLVTGFDADGMTSGNPPIRHSTDDMITMPLQGATQWDSLAHIVFKGRMYNDRPYSLVGGRGAEMNGTERINGQVMGRGVLLDIPKYLGVRYLDSDYVIGGDDLDACAETQGVQVKEGDFILVRTGHITKCRLEENWGDYAGGPRAGLGLSTVPWLFNNLVASVAADNYGVEVNPSEVDGLRSTLHLACVANMGLLFGEIFDLDELALDCGNDGVYEFLFVAPPLSVSGGVGSPINPYAIK